MVSGVKDRFNFNLQMPSKKQQNTMLVRAANASTVCGAIATDTKVTFVLSQYALADSSNANKQTSQPTANNLWK